jgi:hypothetical protein
VCGRVFLTQRAVLEFSISACFAFQYRRLLYEREQIACDSAVHVHYPLSGADNLPVCVAAGTFSVRFAFECRAPQLFRRPGQSGENEYRQARIRVFFIPLEHGFSFRG